MSNGLRTPVRVMSVDEMADRIEELEAKLAQQDDLVQAAVAAALREAAEALDYYVDADYCAMGYPEDGGIAASGTARACQEAILALIPQGAQAALGRVAAAERERIVSIYRKLSTGSAVGAGDGDTFAVRYVDPEQFAAAIRKGGE